MSAGVCGGVTVCTRIFAVRSPMISFPIAKWKSDLEYTKILSICKLDTCQKREAGSGMRRSGKLTKPITADLYCNAAEPIYLLFK